MAIAAFVDAAASAKRMDRARGLSRHVDAGAGLRVRVPGAPGMLRADYAHGLRDGADAWTVGWLLDSATTPGVPPRLVPRCTTGTLLI